MQKSVIEQIHKKSHLGINECINRLKDVFFWSCMAVQIKDIISQCAIWNEFRGAQQPAGHIITGNLKIISDS